MKTQITTVNLFYTVETFLQVKFQYITEIKSELPCLKGKKGAAPSFSRVFSASSSVPIYPSHPQSSHSKWSLEVVKVPLPGLESDIVLKSWWNSHNKIPI